MKAIEGIIVCSLIVALISAPGALFALWLYVRGDKK